jgi:hypothetical protein
MRISTRTAPAAGHDVRIVQYDGERRLPAGRARDNLLESIDDLRTRRVADIRIDIGMRGARDQETAQNVTTPLSAGSSRNQAYCVSGMSSAATALVLPNPGGTRQGRSCRAEGAERRTDAHPRTSGRAIFGPHLVRCRSQPAGPSFSEGLDGPPSGSFAIGSGPPPPRNPRDQIPAPTTSRRTPLSGRKTPWQAGQADATLVGRPGSRFVRWASRAQVAPKPRAQRPTKGVSVQVSGMILLERLAGF